MDQVMPKLYSQMMMDCASTKVDAKGSPRFDYPEMIEAEAIARLPDLEAVWLKNGVQCC